MVAGSSHGAAQRWLKPSGPTRAIMDAMSTGTEARVDPPTRVLRLEVSPGTSVTVKVDAPSLPTAATPGLILAHGANNDLDHPLLAAVAAGLARDGAALVLRFNFPYSERGATSADSRPVLEHTYRRAYELLTTKVLAPGAPVFLGGKSLGGRFAAEFASGAVEGGALPAVGLVVLGYPLHAPGRQDRLNVRPIEGLAIPSLFFVGTRDPFCEPELVEPILAGLPHPGRLHVVEGGDHSFLLPKSSGRPVDDAYDGITTQVARFVRETAGAWK